MKLPASHQAVVVAYRRTAFDYAHKGRLAHMRPDDLATAVVKDVLEDLDFPHTDIEDIILGCAFPEGEQGLNMARFVGLMSGLPESIPAATINRYCGSSMQAIHWACGQISLGAGDVFVAAGVESMSRIPVMGFNPMPHPEFMVQYPDAFTSMGLTAENVARRYDISRADQEEFALRSHQLAVAAQAKGDFRQEMTQLGPEKIFDGCLRADTNLAALQKLAPAFDKEGSVTAGTSSPLTDGAVATVIASQAYATQHNLPILAAIRAVAVTGCEPKMMGIGPVAASQKALERANLEVGDLGVIELNEAFAAQALACQRLLKLDLDKVNLSGGALALGHPLGATGARLVGKAAQLLRTHETEFALATQCIGGGQGIATILEAV